MANTFNPETLCNFCCDVALTETCQILAPLTNFANDCSGDPAEPLRPIIVPVVTAGASVQVNPTNYANGAASSARGITVTPEILSIPYEITHKELNQGYRLESLVRAHAQKLGAAIWGKVLPLIVNDATTPATPPNKFPSGNKVVKALASFTPADIGTLYGKLACSPKHLILSPDAMGKLLYVSGGCCFPMSGSGGGPAAFGFASISEQNLWTGGEPNLYGFAFCPGAIVIASGIPATSPVCSGIMDQRTFTLPGIGLTVQMTTWCDVNGRKIVQSLDIVFGAAFGIACQGVTLVSA